ncbi:hypothetical protein Psta_1877 [Pirellula staleyi DSM 6068]|uniref:SEC-C motif domain protein n=1 Tax=Pirellula staleyi (strain ATCC 27377 / DSM 6068 / ICPB 4128) TaxID=530564 RepID=D2QZR8_PIRSD|nr:hypothetical protein [Pirellula staleyi]ADB16551.1 hypothetical protein Psta_1877 [Pirellula staleyi DSM 6068]
MAVDPYQPCPCGIDKKLKFCCGNEIVGELERVEQAIGGEQRLAALDLINRLLSENSKRPCLHMYKAMVQMGLSELEAARATVQEMLALGEDNPAAQALAAMIDAIDGEPRKGIARLQRALELEQGKLVDVVYQAIGTIGRALYESGEMLAARAHLMFQVGASGSKDQQAVEGLIELQSSGQMPLVAYSAADLMLPDAAGPLSAAGVAAVNESLREAAIGCWAKAIKKLTELTARENEPMLWKNIGVLHTYLAQTDEAIAAFRKYVSLPGVPRDEAVEIEALVQYLSPPSDVDLVSEMTITYSVTDALALQEQLLSNRRLQAMPVDPTMYRTAEEPPPMSVYMVLDREIPASAEGLKIEAIPRVLGELFLFGKQTDRNARVEFVTLKDDQYWNKTLSIAEVLGRFGGGKESEEGIPSISNVGAALMVNWRLPDGTPLELRDALVAEHRQHLMLKVLPEIPRSVLEGKTLRQAAAEPALQNRALAAILLLDLAEPDENPIYNELRKSLGLPTADPIDPSGIRLGTLTPARLVRVDVTKLDDASLVQAYRQSMMLAAARLLKTIAAEVIRRPSLDAELDKAEVYFLLHRTTQSMDEALDYIQKAQAAALATGKSPAQYLLAEVPLRVQRREQQEFVRLVDTIRSKYMSEPGVAQALYQILAQLGLVRPQGGMPMPGGMPGPMAGPPPAAAAPGLWTPDAPAAAPPAAGGKGSKLWLPGMD